jgi:chemotaxis signal transduction protein
VSLHEHRTAVSAAELRRMFDRTFAEAPPVGVEAHEDFLGVDVGGDPYAIRLSEAAGLLSDRTVTWLPGSVAELIGLLGVRGALVPVYDLRALLGYPRTSAARWFLIAAATSVALAFDRFDAHVRVPCAAVSIGPASGAATPSPCVRGIVRTDNFAAPVIHMPSVLDAIAVLVRHRRGRKE